MKFDPGPEATTPPYVAFRFQVELLLDTSTPGVSGMVCRGAFAECSGLEMTMEPKVVRQGGDNQKVTHLMGQINYGQLTLKRGMTDNRDLWNWFAAAGLTGRVSTAKGQVVVADAAGNPSITFTLTECLPVKLSGPALNAKDGQVAIEEMQLVYSSLSVRSTGEASAGMEQSGGTSLGSNVDFNASATADVSVNGGAGLSGGVSASASAAASLNIG